MTDDSVICVPRYASHYSMFYGRTTFWRREFSHYNIVVEPLKPEYKWQYWERTNWVDDPHSSTRTLRPIGEFVDDILH